MQLVVRVDDVGWASNRVPDPGLALARRFHAAMQGLPWLAGIIPACLDDEAYGWLRSNPPGVTIALHGWNHNGVDGGNSEFAGRDLESCRNRIDRGARPLRDAGIVVEHLVLPWNAYEDPLCEACYHEGIRYIWGGGNHCVTPPSRWPTPPPPYPLGRIVFIPSWAPLYGAVCWQMGADDRPLENVLPFLVDLPGSAVLTLHITWEISRHGDLRGVKRLIELIGHRIVSPEQYLQS